MKPVKPKKNQMKFKYFAEKIVPILASIVLVTFFIVMAVKYNKIVLPGTVIDDNKLAINGSFEDVIKV